MSAPAWYLNTANGSEGPFTPDEIRGKIAAEQITDQWFVWREGMAEWKPIAELSELASPGSTAALASPERQVGPPREPSTATETARDKAVFIASGKPTASPQSVVARPATRKTRPAVLIVGLLVLLSAAGWYFGLESWFAPPPPPEPVAPAGPTDAEIVAAAKKAYLEFMRTNIKDPLAASEMLTSEGAAAVALMGIAGTENLEGVLTDAWAGILADTNVTDTQRMTIEKQRAALTTMLAAVEDVRRTFQVTPADISDDTAFIDRLRGQGPELHRALVTAQTEWNQALMAEAATLPISTDRAENMADEMFTTMVENAIRFQKVAPDRVALIDKGAGPDAPVDLAVVPLMILENGTWKHQMALAPIVANMANKQTNLFNQLAGARLQPAAFSAADLDALLPSAGLAPVSVTWGAWDEDARFPSLTLSVKAPVVPFIADLPNLYPRPGACRIEIESVETRDGKNVFDAQHADEAAGAGVILTPSDSALADLRHPVAGEDRLFRAALAGRRTIHLVSGTREADIAAIKGRIVLHAPTGVKAVELAGGRLRGEHAGATLRLLFPPGDSVGVEYRGVLQRLVGFVLVDTSGQPMMHLVSGGTLTRNGRPLPLMMMQVAGMFSRMGLGGALMPPLTGIATDTAVSVIDARLRPLGGARAASVRAWIATDFVERIYPFTVTR